MIEEEDVNKITSNLSFKGPNIYALKDSLPQLSKNKTLDQPLKEWITVYTISITKTPKMFLMKFSPYHCKVH